MVAALVAILALLGFGAESLHMTLVAHAFCATHGEMVHADEHEHGQAHQTERPDDAHDADLAERVESPEDHGHCDLTAVSSTLPEAAPPTADADSLYLRASSAPQLPDVATSRRRRLLQAPKTPPPA